ncbi:hypothetical protein ACH5RR_009941 [Cinchona calisaya]|uniref:Dof zinc finger protein n=1 Tax=Cinchona calisaya TaxID=153742 RepID=A0ABD3AG62_9GENT
MDPSSAQHHHQEMNSQTLESMLVCTKAQQDKKPRPPDQQAQKCPRCESTNTKFCYYNNYSLTQPRYFCKSCRRYWTKGGTLRNVPVGGGCRKNKRSSSSSKRGQDNQAVVTTNTNNPFSSLTNLPCYDSDISLAIARFQKHGINGQLGSFDLDHDVPMLLGNHPNNHFDALRGGGGFLENPNGFHNFYYGMSGGNMGHVENGGGGLGFNVSEEMSMVPYEDVGGGATTSTATTVTTVKQEICNARDNAGDHSRVLWGFPWQVVGGEGSMGDLDSATRQSSWNNGFGGSSWHGLINSPLT